ncbi:unnamed protein product [Spodoptera littoralis]|uniref:Alpha-carbonic anhydrase domain-containing protein n=1 Tax=Spodoptera littoralis TaxID=7109 RepID=A0A9P0IJN6_SPOLI|nr:unnamed protein product [Spodoptera littoralis]CAH1647244.1 unnamed protein product [Spodoptera littoralis]
MYQKKISNVTLWYLLILHIRVSGYTGTPRLRKVTLEDILVLTNHTGQLQDQTSSRTNTLFDDADDIQRQLDNEARDRLKFGRPKTIWVFHFPTHFPDRNSIDEDAPEDQIRYPRDLILRKKPRKEETNDEETAIDLMTPPLPPCLDWEYSSQGRWDKSFPECGGKSQSPVDLPIAGLIKARGARSLLFQNYDVQAQELTLMNDGKRVMLFGEWKSAQRPLIYGGAAHSRRYLFHSLTLHLPAEHTVGGLQYPAETQAFYVSAEYRNLEHALDASPSDPQAFLAVANLYKYSNHSHKGLEELLKLSKSVRYRNVSIKTKSLSYFNPPFKEYACYQGSLSTPPCTESVLWLVRGRTLSVMREAVEEILLKTQSSPQQMSFRTVQPLNDRKVYLFK